MTKVWNKPKNNNERAVSVAKQQRRAQSRDERVERLERRARLLQSTGKHRKALKVMTEAVKLAAIESAKGETR